VSQLNIYLHQQETIEARIKGRIFQGIQRLPMLSDLASSAKYLETKSAAED